MINQLILLVGWIMITVGIALVFNLGVALLISGAGLTALGWYTSLPIRRTAAGWGQ